MTDALALAESLTGTFVQVAHRGRATPTLAVEILEPGRGSVVEPGDLALGIGPATPEAALEVVARASRAAGVVLRPEVVDEAVLAACAAADLTLLTLTEPTTWSALTQMVRTALDRSPHDDEGLSDLFDLADTLSDVLGAPVTVEDHRSRVLAWSRGQTAADGARRDTIIGRRVPRELRDHYRAQGVFRHLARSDEPLLVPSRPDGPKARWVLPIRAGGEWLGSVWAVLEDDRSPSRDGEARLLADVVALHLLRLRARSDLHRLVEVEQVRAVLRGASTQAPDWLSGGPWSVVLLAGPAASAASGPAPGALGAEVREQVWSGVLRRHGWARPLVADLDGEVLALTVPGRRQPGGTEWLASVVATEHRRNPAFWATASAAVHDTGDLAGAVDAVREQAGLGPDALGGPFTRAEDCWPLVHRTRACAVRVGDLASPVRALADLPDGDALVGTLGAVLRHWGDPQAAAREVGVHVNTVRNRLTRISSLVRIDLDDPDQRLACWLECERWRD